MGVPPHWGSLTPLGGVPSVTALSTVLPGTNAPWLLIEDSLHAQRHRRARLCSRAAPRSARTRSGVGFASTAWITWATLSVPAAGDLAGMP